MRALEQVARTASVLRQGRRHQLDLVRALPRRPQLLAGTAAYELAIGLSARVPAHLKVLAELKVASVVACEYCLDIGSALGRAHSVTEQQLRELHRHRSSTAFDDDERLVLDWAEALTAVPAVVEPRLRARLEQRFDQAELGELASTIAWENHRARLNQALGVRPSGFSDGKLCALAQHAGEPASAADTAEMA